MTKARDLADGANAFDVVSVTELEYLNGVSSAIQTQIDGKQAVVSGVDSTEIGYLDGVSSAIQTQIDGKTAKSTLTTTGDIYYASSANTPARLGIGSAGQVLTVSSGIPSWAAASTGKVVQMVIGTHSTEVSTTSTSLVDTNLSASITPTSASNDVYVFVTHNGIAKSGGNAATCIEIAVLRGSTNIQTAGNRMLETDGQTFQFIGSTFATIVKDSPATTSSTTYKTQYRNDGGVSQGVFIGVGSSVSTILLMEVAP